MADKIVSNNTLVYVYLFFKGYVIWTNDRMCMFVRLFELIVPYPRPTLYLT